MNTQSNADNLDVIDSLIRLEKALGDAARVPEFSDAVASAVGCVNEIYRLRAKLHKMSCAMSTGANP